MTEFVPEKLNTRNNLEMIIDASPAGTLIVDDQGCIQMTNQQVLDWFGYSREELLGQRVELLMPEQYRAEHVPLRHTYAKRPVVRPMKGGMELQARRKNGSEFPVNISLHPLELEHDQFVILAYIVDSTERRARERLQRLALIGQLAASVAHEIRNPLGVIRNSAYYLRLIGGQLDEEGHACIEDIDREIETANRIVNELLDFTRETSAVRQPVSLIQAVEQALSYARVPPSLRIVKELEEITLMADQGQIERILTNLIRNAVQAMGDSGILTLRSDRRDDCDAVAVADTGPGIPPENLPRIFEPLFTTKAKGVGLGLAISRRYAEQNQARLDVESTPGQGAVFILSFPRKVHG